MARARKLSSRSGESVLAGVRPGWWTPLALIVLTTVGFAQRSADPSEAGRKPGIDLPAVAHAQISAAIGEDQPLYHARAQAEGFRMENANHQVSSEFTPRGVEFRHGKNRWGMALRRFGHGDTLRETRVTSPRGSANRVEYRRDALTEWYLNGPLGVEQGFTLERAPGPANGKPLTLAFVLSGNLTPSVAPGGRALTLKRDDATALRYGGLTAWDADRRELRAWLEVAGGELRVQVDDSGADRKSTRLNSSHLGIS